LSTKDNKRLRMRYCELCEEDQPKFIPKCYTKEDKDMQPQVCKKCHARFCCECQLKPFVKEFGYRWTEITPITKQKEGSHE